MGNTVITLMSGAAIVKDLPEIADKLGDAIKKTKKISKSLDDFVAKSLSEKLEDISNIWKIKYPLPDMFEGRHLFEDIMGHYRYKKADGWAHTADIAENFKGVDFYKGVEIEGIIDASEAISMKTTILTDVNKWLNSKPIQDNIKFLKEGLDETKGINSNNKVLIIENAKIDIYMPKENITKDLLDDWNKELSKITKQTKIEFEIKTLEDFIK